MNLLIFFFFFHRKGKISNKTYRLKIRTRLRKRIKRIAHDFFPLQIHLLHIHHRFDSQPTLFLLCGCAAQRAAACGGSVAVVETVGTVEIDIIAVAECLVEIEIGIAHSGREHVVD